MTRPTAYDEQFVHQIPELLPNVALAPRVLAGELLLRRPRPGGHPGRRRPVLHAGPLPGESPRGLAADGSGRGRGRLRVPRPSRRRRPAHARSAGHPLRGRAAVGGGPHRQRPRRRDDRMRPHVPRPHPAVRSAPGHDARRRRRGVGPVPHLPVGHVLGQLHRRGRDARDRRLDRAARPLVGHPRPRSLPVVALVPAPARGRLPRRLALGAPERRPRLHRRLLGRHRRQRPGPRRRLQARDDLDRGRPRVGASTASTATTSPVSPAPASSRSRTGA